MRHNLLTAYLQTEYRVPMVGRMNVLKIDYKSDFLEWGHIRGHKRKTFLYFIKFINRLLL